MSYRKESRGIRSDFEDYRIIVANHSHPSLVHFFPLNRNAEPVLPGSIYERGALFSEEHVTDPLKTLAVAEVVEGKSKVAFRVVQLIHVELRGNASLSGMAKTNSAFSKYVGTLLKTYWIKRYNEYFFRDFQENQETPPRIKNRLRENTISK